MEWSSNQKILEASKFDFEKLEKFTLLSFMTHSKKGELDLSALVSILCTTQGFFLMAIWAVKFLKEGHKIS